MRRLHHRRRGTVYLLVLGSATLLALIGVSTLTVNRIQRQAANGTNDLTEARFYARSAIENGLYIINNDSNWRYTRSTGDWRINQPIGSGTFTLQGIDPTDGDLTDSGNEPLLLTGIGMKGLARHKMQVLITSVQKGLSCVQVALDAGGSITLNSATVQKTGMTISTNGTCTATSSTVNCNAESASTITGGAYNGSTTAPVAARVMPPSTVFDYYVNHGTAINFSSIPSADIQDVVISPSINPYGAQTNPKGIYVINCGGQQLRIEYARIIGTLVLINPRSDSEIRNSIAWEPAVANYPVLLVSGACQLNYTNTVLSESSRNINFNPDGAAYSGSTNTDKLDTYPSLIKGLVYISGALTTSTYVTIDGVLVIGSTLTTSGTLDLTYRQTYYDDPPPGFEAPAQFTITPGGWTQGVN